MISPLSHGATFPVHVYCKCIRLFADGTPLELSRKLPVERLSAIGNLLAHRVWIALLGKTAKTFSHLISWSGARAFSGAVMLGIAGALVVAIMLNATGTLAVTIMLSTAGMLAIAITLSTASVMVTASALAALSVMAIAIATIGFGSVRSTSLVLPGWGDISVVFGTPGAD